MPSRAASKTTWPPVVEVLSQVLEIVGVSAPERRQEMIAEVEHLAEMRAEQIVWEGLPKAVQDQIRELPGPQKRELMAHHAQRSTMELALLQATEEVVPDYIATMTQVATPEQKQQIESLLQSLER